MNVLLDTCALPGLARGDLPDAASNALRKAPEAFVSVVSPWELAIEVVAGKLRLTMPPAAWFLRVVDRYDLREIALDASDHVTVRVRHAVEIDGERVVAVGVGIEQGHVAERFRRRLRGHRGRRVEALIGKLADAPRFRMGQPDLAPLVDMVGRASSRDSL